MHYHNKLQVENTNQYTIRQALEDNMLGHFSYLPKHVANMEVIEDNTVTVVNSHCHSDMFNIICKVKAQSLDHLTKAVHNFTIKQLPFACWTGFDGEPHSLKTSLEQLNLHCTEQERGMAINLTQLVNKTPYEDLKIRSVKYEADLKDFVDVIAKLVPNEAQAIRCFYQKSSRFILAEDSPIKLFVGHINYEPIATSRLFCHAGVAGIWDIITLPEVQRKGIGTDMTLKALHVGKQLGYQFGVLTASEEGQFVYEKLGFEPLQAFSIYNLA